MKKFITAVVAIVLILSMVFTLASCARRHVPKEGEVAEAIAAAQKMTEAELLAAAKKELDAASEKIPFNADSLTSGIKKALTKFAEKYDIPEEKLAYNSKKGSEYQPVLRAGADSNQYVADFVMIQDAGFVQEMVDNGFLLSYVPQGSDFKFDKADTAPMVGVSFNKVFMYNNSQVGKDQFKNVWQMTDVEPAAGSTLKNKLKVSFQNPLNEDINMNFLIMLTSPEACEKLTAAYKEYTGKDYVKNDNYVNIGYEFVAKYLANVSTWHGSDTTEIKELNNEDKRDGRLVFAGLCKLKDYPGYDGKKIKNEAGEEVKITADNPMYYKNIVTAAGWNNDVVGFPGFVYNMWTLIPKTCSMPYTACLFVRYLLTTDGFNAGWGDILGYYSANQNIPSVSGDPALATWKTNAIVEDVTYIKENGKTVKAFINQQMDGKGSTK